MSFRHSLVAARQFALPGRVQTPSARCVERNALDAELRTHARAFATPLVAITSLVVAGFLAACFV